MRKITIFIIIVCLVLIAGAVYLGLTHRKGLSAEENNPPIAGGDRDAHGCIGSAGYSWCEAKNKCLRAFEEFCPDAVAGLVDKINTASGIELLFKGETSFSWILPSGNANNAKTISGNIYQVNDIKFADYTKIDNFLSQNYKVDIYNEADGVSGGQRGYQVDYMACLLNFRHNHLKETPNAPTEVVGDSLTVKLECGYFNPNTP